MLECELAALCLDCKRYSLCVEWEVCKKADNVSMWAQVPEVKVTAQALLPSTSVIGFTLGNGLSFTTFVNTVPINEHRTVNRFALIRCLLKPINAVISGHCAVC